MDIGIIQPELIYPRGAEKQVCKLSYYLTKMGHEVTIYTFEKKEPYIFDPLLKDVEIISLNVRWFVDIPYGQEYLRWLYLIKKISKKVKEHDVINAHNHPAQWISKFTKIPTIWMCNEPPMYYNIPKDIRRLKYFFHDSFDRYLSSNVRLVLALDSIMKEIIKEKYLNKRVEIIGSGVDLNRKIKHSNNNYFDVLFVGPIYPQKRPLDIIQVCSLIKEKVSNLRLHFVGDVILPELKKEMVTLSQKNSLDIIFYNSVSDEKLYELYDVADMVVFVPEAQPWGIFPLETILAGIPTIISDQCGIKDILPNDFPIVETGNFKQIASRILEIIENYEEYRKKTNEISKIISEKYSWEAYSKRMVNIFNFFIKKSPSKREV